MTERTRVSRTASAADLSQVTGDRSHPVLMLFLATAAAAVTLAVINVAWLANGAYMARLRELELLTLIRSSLEKFDLNPIALAPDFLSRPFRLVEPALLGRFLALSLVVHLVVFWALAAAIVPMILVARRMFRSRLDHDASCWLWNHAGPLGAFATCVMLGGRRLILTIAGGHSHAFLAAAGGASAAALWLGLSMLLRRPERTRRVLLACTAVGVGGLVIGLIQPIGRTVLHPRAASASQPAAAAGTPNVLLISIDSLRRDHVHCYGYARATSPTIDSLAREGVMFRTVVSPTSWTLPAHLTLLTSLPPEEHGVVDDGRRVSESVVFLAEVLWRAGFTTAGFVSAPYLDATYGFSQGFDHYDDYTVAKVTFDDSDRASQTSPKLEHLVGQWLTAWDGGGRRRPFFVFLHMWDVHYDYNPPPPYDAMFDPGYRGKVNGKNYMTSNQVHLGMDQRDLDHVIALYDGEIRYADSYIGRILDRLRHLGVLDNTIVVVTADHGDEFFEHGRKGHAKTLYDESVLVPLVIRFPRMVSPGKVINAQVRLMDIAPTIIGLAGVRRPSDFGGSALPGTEAAKDLSPWLSKTGSERPAGLPAFGDLRVSDAPRKIASVRTDDTKLIGTLEGPSRQELYDLRRDPGEHDNIVSQDAVHAVPLEQQLTGWRKRWDERNGLSEHVELSDEHKEVLRSLGYLGGGH